MKRFWDKVEINNLSECWPWIAGKGQDYGYFYNGKRMEHAHRISYRITFGDFNHRKLVCHKCNNSMCVNPFHLYLGDKGSNARDCKGTIGRQSRWYDGEVWLMRKLHSKGIGQYIIGRMFKVNQSTISDILNNPNYPTKESHIIARRRINSKQVI